MPIVYEHWRPDTNECFYVGMSARDEAGAIARANDFLRPTNKYHTNIVRKLRLNNLEPYSIIVEVYADAESAKAREKMQIAYRRAIIGNKLTNIADGGDGGPSLFGDANPMSRPEVRAKVLAYLQGDNAASKKPENRLKTSIRVSGANNPGYGKTSGNGNPMDSLETRLKLTGDNNPLKNPIHKQKHFEKVLRGDASPMKKPENIAKISGQNHYKIKSPEKAERNANAVREWKKSEEGIKFAKEYGEMLRATGARKGEKNNNSKLTQSQVIEIKSLLFEQHKTMVDVAKQYNVSLPTIKRIKYGKAWT